MAHKRDSRYTPVNMAINLRVLQMEGEVSSPAKRLSVSFSTRMQEYRTKITGVEIARRGLEAPFFLQPICSSLASISSQLKELHFLHCKRKTIN
jgi:hypothetical protein